MCIRDRTNAFLLNLGLETLAVRMERHCANALAMARYLEKNDKISWVNYPGLEGNRYHALAEKYMPNGSCGVISFGIKGGREAAQRFMDHLKLASVVIHVADLRTCVPVSYTHLSPMRSRWGIMILIFIIPRAVERRTTTLAPASIIPFPTAP